MTATEALQGWLALEHEAVWLHPVIAARHDGLADRARRSYAAHRAVRDRLLARLHALNVEPVGAALAYDIGRVRRRRTAAEAARQIERDIQAACLTLVGESTGDTQAYAIKGLLRAAGAELAWGGRPRSFPGLSTQS